MGLGRVRLATGAASAAFIEGNQAWLLPTADGGLASILHAPSPSALASRLRGQAAPIDLATAHMLAPVDAQEIWAAGVTYKRSQEARERESEGAAKFYDLVYSAPRPELFLKATASRIVGPELPIRVRKDSRWSVPEPELALVVSPELRIVGYTIGNDVSARDIEGENPLYLPQAKIYRGSCAIGPTITLVEAMPPLSDVVICLTIERQGKAVFTGSTSPERMKRPCEELVRWLGTEIDFPDGAILLTGTGIVPPDEFALASGDVVHIDITGIGRLTNPVE